MRWVLRRRAYRPYHLLRYWRFLLFRLRNPGVTCEGLVFLGRGVRVSVRKGHARLVLGRFTHLGDGVRLYAHEGTLRVGGKCVLGQQVTIASYLDVEVGESTLLADWTYISDFDHVTTALGVPIKDQGLVKSPVRIGADCWLGIRSTVLRGSRIGAGVVVGAHAVVRGALPDACIAAGVPAEPVRDRRVLAAADADRSAYLAGLARGVAADLAAAEHRAGAGVDAGIGNGVGGGEGVGGDGDRGDGGDAGDGGCEATTNPDRTSPVDQGR